MHPTTLYRRIEYHQFVKPQRVCFGQVYLWMFVCGNLSSRDSNTILTPIFLRTALTRLYRRRNFLGAAWHKKNLSALGVLSGPPPTVTDKHARDDPQFSWRFFNKKRSAAGKRLAQASSRCFASGSSTYMSD
jgi:hypothetical protein